MPNFAQLGKGGRAQ